MSDLRFDLRIALRSLMRQRSFVAVVVLTLGLGIGANSAMFSIVNAVLLKPLPYREPAALALIWSRWSNFDKTWISPAEYLDYKAQDRLFTDVAAWGDNGEVALTGPEGPQSLPVIQMTANLFNVLGLQPARGRAFAPEEDVANGPPVVMIGWDLWQGRYQGDPGVVGRTILVNGVASEVIGVMPREFRFPLEFQSRTTAQVVQPLGLETGNPSRGNHGLFGVARLRPGITAGTVTTELAALARRWTEEGLYPPAMRFTAFAVPVVEEVSGKARLALVVLGVAVALLLLLTCVNVANLILIRAHGRSREVALRAALGAGRRHIVRLALTESLLLGLAGGAFGLLLAWAAIRLLVARAPTTVPRLAELGFDVRVLLFTFALSVGAGLLFGLIPAWRSLRPGLGDALREGARGQSGGVEMRRTRGLLVVTEMALAVLLVIGAGLTARSFLNLMRLDPGFDSRRVLTLRLSLPAATYGDVASVGNFWQALRRDVAQLPGVEAAGLVRVLPIAAEMGDAGLVIDGNPVPAGEPGRQADWQAVSPGYFEAMRIKAVRGRLIDETDRPDGLQVIVINETLAQQYFPALDPIGQRIRIGGADRPFRTVVGVVADNHHNGLTNPVKRAFFVPESQWANSYGNPRRAMSLVVRTLADPRALMTPVTELVGRMDPDLPVTQLRTMDDVMGEAVQEQRFTMALMAGFALLALLLASVGIYGVIAYGVGQRTQEIGIRLALGAEPRDVRALIMRQGMVPAATGVLVGLGLALYLSRYLRSILYGVAPIDAPTFVAIPLLLLGVAAAAVFLPAARASRTEPVHALRSD